MMSDSGPSTLTFAALRARAVLEEESPPSSSEPSRPGLRVRLAPVLDVLVGAVGAAAGLAALLMAEGVLLRELLRR